MKRWIYFVVGLILLGAFVWLSFLVKRDIFDRFDFDSTVKIQNHIPKKYDVYLSFFSLIGSFELTFAFLIIILILRKKLSGIFVVGLFAFAHVIELFGKSLITHQGPPFMFFRYTIPFLFPSSYVQPGSSYPSGHALRTVFLTTIIIYLISGIKRSRAYKIIVIGLLIVFNIVMLTTRVSLGEHWSSDVLGGSFLGASFGFISLLFL